MRKNKLPMRAIFGLGSFSVAGAAPFPGLTIADRVIAVNALLPWCERLGIALVSASSVFDLVQHWDANFDVLGRALAAAIDHGPDALPFVAASDLHVHAPFEPRTIYAAGANYRQHVIDIITDRHGDPALSHEENRRVASAMMDERAANGVPYIFLKSAASLGGPFDVISLPPDAKQPDWELELAVVIGRRARRIAAADAFSYIAGYAIANDVSDRGYVFRTDLKEIGSDWLSCKSSPTYTPFGPYLVPAAFVADPQSLDLRLTLNGEVMQNARTSDMIFGIARLLEYLSTRVELRPGDILLTGSPAGNGTHYNRYLKPGDVMECSITGLGRQRTSCVAETNSWQSTVLKPYSIA